MSRWERQEKSQKKHPIINSSSTSRAAFAPVAPSRPVWKGPGFIKKVPRQPTRPSPQSLLQSTIQLLPLELQQLILSIFQRTFPVSNDWDSLKPILKEVKDALVERDFDAAFARRELLEAHAVRWGPGRALCLGGILAEMCEGPQMDEGWVSRLRAHDGPTRVVCLGGGAEEIMAFAGLLRFFRPEACGNSSKSDTESVTVAQKVSDISVSEPAPLLNLDLVNEIPWSPVINSLHSSLIIPPVLSKYASATARANNTAFLSQSALLPIFKQFNLLDASSKDLSAVLSNGSDANVDPVLVTLCFTLNNLFATSIPRTTAFLLKLTTGMSKGDMLLVVDSAEVEMEGIGERKYPMHWLIDHVLLGKKGSGKDEHESEDEKKDGELEGIQRKKWEKVKSEENTLFKLEEGLKYPVSLESLRVQVHLFRRL